jgi:hypothetical protein
MDGPHAACRRGEVADRDTTSCAAIAGAQTIEAQEGVALGIDAHREDRQCIERERSAYRKILGQTQERASLRIDLNQRSRTSILTPLYEE